MGKKIPKSRKHKKLKFVDPAYKGKAPRGKKKHLQFNNPPENEDFQEMPAGIHAIMDFQNKMKENKETKQKRNKKRKFKDDFIIVRNNILDTNEPGMEKAVKKMPKTFKQKKNETEGQFFNRLQKMADVAKAEAKVEEKYNIELVSIDKDGNAQYKSGDNNIVNEGKKRKRKKYKEKMQERKKLKTDDKEFELKKDVVKFGEVVSAPPNLTAKPKKAGQEIWERLQFNSAKKTTKLKEMSLDKRKETENERQRAVQMYRLLKNKKV